METQVKEAQDNTVKALIDRSKRKKNLAIRNDFVQTGNGKTARPGVLGELISSKNGRSLDLYLLHRLVAAAEPWDTTLGAAVWARALGLPDNDYGKSAVSRCWATLEKHGLITKTRVGRKAKITTLREGTRLHEGEEPVPYTRPTARFFTLPLEYWTEGWHRTLKDAGKAVLLISSSLSPGFYLPGRQAPSWYGISADTLHKGFRDLETHGLITYENRNRTDWITDEVTFVQRHFTLNSPFGKESRGADAFLMSGTIFGKSANGEGGDARKNI